MNKPILQIKNLAIRNKHSGEIILDNVSFPAEKQKITGLVGESGSGKSITALSIMGLLPPSLEVTRGEVVLHSGNQAVDLLRLPSEKMNAIRGREISMIFQEPMVSLNPSMKCGTQTAEPLVHHLGLSTSDARQKVIELFGHTGLPNPERIFSSYPHQLSGGQRQRVMIAMALSTNPSLVIADEPTTALDVSVQKSIIGLLRKLQEEFSLSILFITHDLRLLGEIADHIAVMKSGRLIEFNTKSRIFLKPEALYTRGLLACQPPLDHRPERLITIQELENQSWAKSSSESPAPAYPHPEDKRTELLKIRDLSVIYRRSRGIFSGRENSFKALEKIQLTLYKGETLGLVGESGCGKTTLGKAILRLLENHTGDIVYRGKDIRKMNRPENKIFRKNVQVVFQDPYSSLNPRIKIGTVLKEIRNLHFPNENRQEQMKRIVDLMEHSGLKPSDLTKYPHQFSGGQRQRIGIVRALVTEPELLVLDESVSALDVSVQAQILNLLNDLKKTFELSYLFISHDLAVVNYMSDRIIVMKDGRFEEEGKAYEMFNNPVSDYTRKLIEAIPAYQNSSNSS